MFYTKAAFITALAAGGAHAFMTPSLKTSVSTSSNKALKGAEIENLFGSDVEAPFWDPLDLSVDRDEDTIAWYRAAELKHGRVCMLAMFGIGTAALNPLPDPVFSEKMSFAALSKVWTERPQAIIQIILAIAAVETASLITSEGRAPGDVGFDPLKFEKRLSEEEFDKLRLQELKNGRLAMIATAGVLTQEWVTGISWADQLSKF